MRDVINGVLVATLNKAEAELSSLYNEDGNLKEDASSTIEAWAKEASAKRKAALEQQRQRGQAEKGKEWEGYLKSAGVEIGDATGEEAVKKFTEFIAERSKPSELPDDQVKHSPFFRKREQELLNQLESIKTEWAKKWADRDAKEKSERTYATVEGKADIIFKEVNPVLPKDPKVAANQKDLFFRQLRNYGYEVDGETVYVLNGTERIEDDHGNPVRFDQFTKNLISSLFEIPVSDERSTAGNITKGTITKQSGAGVNLKKPANGHELRAMYDSILKDNSMDAKERTAKLDLLESWEHEYA